MNEEIKEIIKNETLLKKVENILGGELTEEEYDEYYNYLKEYQTPNIIVDIKDCKNLSDYITNLQQKYEIAQKDIESLKNNYNDLIKMSENKIDNLQQEIEELREYKKNATRKHWQQKCAEKGLEIINLQQENERLKECYCNRTDCGGRIKDSKKYDSLLQKYEKLQQENERLKEELNYTVSQVQHNQIVTKLCKEKEDYKSRCEQMEKELELWKKKYGKI